MPVILAEATATGRDMGDMMEQESGVRVVYLDPLNRGDYSADSYLDGMRSNLELLIASLRGGRYRRVGCFGNSIEPCGLHCIRMTDIGGDGGRAGDTEKYQSSYPLRDIWPR